MHSSENLRDWQLSMKLILMPSLTWIGCHQTHSKFISSKFILPSASLSCQYHQLERPSRNFTFVHCILKFSHARVPTWCWVSPVQVMPPKASGPVPSKFMSSAESVSQYFEAPKVWAPCWYTVAYWLFRPYLYIRVGGGGSPYPPPGHTLSRG
jgi:hypothetical protein